jgi:hypothetical protein
VNEQDLRLSDAEREQAAAELGEHYAQGRLTMEEHAERLDRIWASRTRGELGPIFRDLPGRAFPQPAPPPRRATYWSGGVGPVRRGLPTPLVVVLAILVLLTVATHLPLILIGLLVWFFVVGRHRRRGWHRHWSA